MNKLCIALPLLLLFASLAFAANAANAANPTQIKELPIFTYLQSNTFLGIPHSSIEAGQSETITANALLGSDYIEIEVNSAVIVPTCNGYGYGCMLTTKVTGNTNIFLGQNDIITLNIFGGSSPYVIYHVTKNGHPIVVNGSIISQTNTSNTSTINYRFHPSQTGSYTFVGSVRGSFGYSVNTLPFTVIVTNANIVTSVTGNTMISLGQNDVITLSINGGQSPYTIYDVLENSNHVDVNGAIISQTNTSDSAVINYKFKPTMSGTYTFVGSVRDTTGATVNTLPFTVWVSNTLPVTPAISSSASQILGIKIPKQ